LNLSPGGKSKPVRSACSKASPVKDYAIWIVGFANWIARQPLIDA
jgi:hypothetical protein